MTKRPLEGVRIIDSTYVFAMPYACGLLTDLGAEVIKVEGIQHPDRTAQGGLPDGQGGDDAWNRTATFNQINRGKRSLTLDLSREEGRQAFKDLVKVTDIVVENYTPRVMRRWGMDYPNLKQIKPDLIMVSNTGYGHSVGPYTQYPGQATTMEGTHGLTWITGYLNDIPGKAGQSYLDFLACWNGLFAVASALHYRNRTGKGQWVDLGMYQLGCYYTGEYILDYIANGRENGRMGNRHPWRAPQGCYPCEGKDAWCTLSVGDDAEWQALCKVMGSPELAGNPRFATALARREHHDELDAIISRWSRTVDKFHMMERLQAAGVPAGAVFDSKDENLSPHYWARGFLQKLSWPPEREMGTRVLMGRPWQFSKTPMRILEGVHTLGQDNRYLLRDLAGYSDEQLAQLTESKIIGERPVAGARGAGGQLAAPANRPPGSPPVSFGGFSMTMDPAYKERLGI